METYEALNRTMSRKEKQTEPGAGGIKHVGLNSKPYEYALSKRNNKIEHPRCICRITLLTEVF